MPPRVSPTFSNATSVGPPAGPPLGATTSLTLDGLRLLAAAVVLVFHASGMWTTTYPVLHEVLGKAAHAAVVVFFVISGYVIAFTAARRDAGPRHYAVARLSRLYSVLLPALLITAVIEMVGVASDPAVAARYVHAYSWARYGLSAVFGNESGWWSAAPPINSPLWSLSYEFWYYTLFGLWMYRRSVRKGGWWLALAAVLAGPKILLLLPNWLFGVAAYRCTKPLLTARLGALLAALLLGLVGLAVAYLPAWPMAVGDRPLFMAGQFATDWVVGLLVAMALWLLPAGQPAAGRAGVRALRRAADLSFPLYVLHFPLLVLVRALCAWRANDLGQLGLAIGLVTLGAGLIGWALERQRGRWIRFFNWVIERVKLRTGSERAAEAQS